MDMKSISQKLQDDIRKIMEGNVDEALVGKQRNIDVNKNGKIDGEDFVKLRAMKKTPDGKVHNCATHVEHAVLGKGVTISEQHAEPDAEGKIEWYTVQFENSTQKVLTKDLTITMSESHEHKNKKNKMEEAANRAQQAAIAISLIKAGKKDGKMPKSMKEEEEKKKVVSPFDFKNYKSQIPKKPGELTGHDSKKTSTGTVYSKKPFKEEVEELDEDRYDNMLDAMLKKDGKRLLAKNAKDIQRHKDINSGKALQQHIKKNPNVLKTYSNAVKKDKKMYGEEFSFSDYLVAAIHIVGEDYAVELANYAYNLQDTSIFENLETEAFNASNVNATHAADIKAHHSTELKKKADAGDENAKKRMELIKKSREAKTSEFNSRMDYM